MVGLQPEPTVVPDPRICQQLISRQAAAINGPKFANPVPVESSVASEVVTANGALATTATEVEAAHVRLR